MAGMMGVVASLMVPLSAPNGLISSKYTFCRRFLLVKTGPVTPRERTVGNTHLPTFFACHRGARRRQPNEHASEPAHFEVTLGSFWGHLGAVSISVGDFGSVDGYFAMIVESLWVYEGPFSKNTHFPIDFNDFVKLWS